ncbi:MAG: methyltransferase [Polyangiaceae bacterium]
MSTIERRKGGRGDVSGAPPSWSGIEGVEVESLAPGGAGLVRLASGEVGFVDGVLPGESVRVRSAGKVRGARRLELVEVVRASTERVSPACPHQRACGGCDWMHMSAAAQGRGHADIVRGLLARAVGSCPEPTVREAPTHHRTRARLVIHVERGRATLGFRERGSHALASIDDCQVLAPSLFAAARRLSTEVAIHVSAPSSARREDGRGIRGVAASGRAVDLQLAIAFGAGALPVVDLEASVDLGTAFFQAIDQAIRGSERWLAGAMVRSPGAREPARFGDPRAVQRGLDGLPMVAPSGGFAQSSDAGASLLAERTVALAAPQGRHVFELFSGSGTLSVELARHAASLTSVELEAAAVACARENLQARGLHATLRQGDAERTPIPAKAELVVLDPPRAGAAGAVAAIAAARPRDVVYVSCDPATLARDAAVLARAGYGIAALETLELFPETSHVETLCRFTRSRARER